MAEEVHLRAVQGIVARILQLPADEIDCDAPINSLKGWDSILRLTLVFAIEDEVGYQLTQQDLLNCHSVRDFARLLDQHANGRITHKSSG